jgi:drug/metabolite transporter (DMT)-like permease
MRLRADLTLLLVAILWGSAFAAQRIAGQEGSVFFFNAVRFLLAAMLLLPFGLKNRISRQQFIWMAVAGTILFTAGALQQAGLTSTTAGNAGFITSLYVVLVPFVVWVGWRERPHWLAGVAAVLAAIGAFLLSTGGSVQFRAGDWLELAGALFWSLHVVVVGKFARTYESISFSSGQLWMASLLSFAAVFLFEGWDFTPSPALIGAIIYTAFISLGLGYTLQIWGQKHTPPTDAAIILSLESVFAVFGARLVLGEQLAPMQILGCVIILAAVILSQARGWGKIDLEVR